MHEGLPTIPLKVNRLSGLVSSLAILVITLSLLSSGSAFAQNAASSPTQNNVVPSDTPHWTGKVQVPPPSKAEVDAFLKEMDDNIRLSETRPEKLSDDEIVKYIGSTLKDLTTGKEHLLTMWDGPMRMGVVLWDGTDVDLTSYPGIIIANYIKALADFTGVPISVTKVKNHDNNASMIIGYAKTGNAGALYGVPELADYVSKPANGLMGIAAHSLDDIKKNDPEYVKKLTLDEQMEIVKTNGGRSFHEGGSADFNFGSYTIDHKIKGAVLEVDLPRFNRVGYPGMLKAYRHSAELISEFYGLPRIWVHLPDVEALEGTKKPWFESPFTTQNEGPDMSFIAPSHQFYFWRLEHNAGVKPGMDRKTLEATVSNYLKQHPKN